VDKHLSLQSRNWVTLSRSGCFGRFVPDTELPGYEAALDRVNRTPMSYEEWLRGVTTEAVDTEINMQLNEFTLKKHPMQVCVLLLLHRVLGDTQHTYKRHT
jgi:hypothetical protein